MGSEVGEGGRFEFQKWPVYQAALDLVDLSYRVCEALPKESVTGLRDQLKRAAQSIPLNIVEGCARSTAKDKCNFWRVAKGSVFECVAIFDLIKTLRLVQSDLVEVYEKLQTIGKMLSGLIRYVEKASERRVG